MITYFKDEGNISINKEFNHMVAIKKILNSIDNINLNNISRDLKKKLVVKPSKPAI